MARRLGHGVHVLILHMRYWPDPTGTGPLVTDLARGLVDGGDTVTVIASTPHYGRSDVPERYRWKLAVRENDAGVHLWRTAAFPWWSAHPIGRALDYALYTLLAAVLGLGSRKPDVVLAIAPPITIAPVAWLVSRVKNAPLVYNAQDIWPDGLVQMGRLRPGPLLSLLRRLESWVYSIADRVVVVSEGMRANLEHKGVGRDGVRVQRNWVDTQEVKPVDGAEWRAEHDLADAFVVLFAGNLGYAAGLDLVLEAADSLRDRPAIRFLLVGEGSAKESLVAQAQERELSNVHFLTTQPRPTLSSMLGAADLCLVTLRAGMGSLSVPSKTYTYMAAGRPVLASVPEDSEIRDLLNTCGCGRWVPAGSPGPLAQAVLELREDPERLDEMGAQGRDYAMAHLSRESALAGYRSLLRDVQEGQE